MGLQSIVTIAIFILAPVAIFVIATWPECVIDVRSGKVELRRGRVARSAIAELQELLETEAVEEGRIKAMRRGNRLTLRFSKGIPPSVHQRIRNILSARSG